MSLPSTYKQLEYLESTGTQVLRIWSNWNTSYKTIIDFQLTEVGADTVILWIRNSSYYRYYFWQTTEWRVCTWSTTITGTWATADLNRHTATLNQGTFIIDWTSYSCQNSSTSFSKWLCIYWYSAEDNNYYGFSKTRVYSFKAYSWSTLLYDLVPCVRKSDNKPGMYDLVNNVFYTNQGTGEFVMPPVVNPWEHEMVNAYIWEDTWKPWSNTVMYYPFVNDQLDKVWSSSISTTWTNEALWYTFSSSWQMWITNPPTNCRFVSVWVKYNSANWQYNQWPMTYIWWMLYNFWHSNSSYLKKFQAQTASSSWNVSSEQSTSTWIWYYMAFWYDWTKAIAYINWSKVREQTMSVYTSWTMFIWSQINETLSEYIWESVFWTESEIQSYYYNTKSNYVP